MVKCRKMNTEQPKVFFFCPALIAGGLERVLSILSYTLAKHYSNVTYIMWYDKPVFYQLGNEVKVVSVEKESGEKEIVKRMIWLRKYVQIEQPDIFISFSTPFSMLALVSLWGLEIRVVVSERNDPAHFRWGIAAKLLRNILYLKAKGLLVQTNTSKNHLWKPLQKKAVVIPNPIMMDDHIVGAALKSDKEHFIVAASRHVPQKRIDLIIRAFDRFIKVHSDYKLYIYGEGPEKERLQGLIDNLGVSDSVEIPGVVKNLWEQMRHAEMFVMSSEYEGMSNALLEAMAIGLPCISTKVSGALDIITDGKNGILVDINDEEAMLNSMLRLAGNKDLRESIGAEASHVIEDLSLTRVAAMWTDYIDKLITS